MSESRDEILLAFTKLSEADKEGIRRYFRGEPVASPQATRPDAKCPDCMSNNPKYGWLLCRNEFHVHTAQPAAGTTAQAERPDSPYNAVSAILGKYLNTMVSDLRLEGKGQYLRDLFSKYEKEVSLAEVKWRARAVAPVETPDGKHFVPDNGHCKFCGKSDSLHGADGSCVTHRIYKVVETRLTAEQFFATFTGREYDGHYGELDVFAFAEAFRDKSEAELPHEGLTAAQFADSDGWKFGADAKQTAYRFAEEYSAIWQRIAARLEAQNAGLREEIERLKRQLSSALKGEDDALRACREKGK